MPRKKGQGVHLQRKFVTKPSTCLQFNKTALDAKTTEDGDASARLPMVSAASMGAVDGANTNYLHKKFKKVAGMSAAAAATAKTECNLPNGIVSHQESHWPTNGLVSHADEPRLTNGVTRPAVAKSPNGVSSAPSEAPGSEDDLPSSQPGRYICPYCQMVCAKPSVLQKHIRAHTNERPYPCTPCGFAFKTKSNLYKHCRSQAHRIKTGRGEAYNSADSDASDESSQSGLDNDDSKPVGTPPRIYKPKFHKAALYNDDTPVSGGEASPKSKFPSPITVQLEERISKIIRDNQLIFDTMEPQFSKKYLQRQNSREKESDSPKAEDIRRSSETKSKLALALLKVDKIDRSYSPSYPQVNFENHTYQPLNLTKKSIGPTILSGPEVSRGTDLKASYPVDVPSTSNSRTSVEPDADIGPLLGSTPLVEGPNAKKRRVMSTTVPPDHRALSAFASRRLSTSSLPSTLKSLEELSRHPMKHPGVHLFGGEVKILDGSEPRTVRIDGSPEIRAPTDDSRVVTIAKTGFLGSGGTLVTPSPSAFNMANILSLDASGIILAPNIVTPNLAVPGVPQPESGIGVLTIMHGEKAIPFVPGMPGPQSLVPDPPRRPKPSLSSLTTVSKTSSSTFKLNVPNDVPKIEISSPPAEERPGVQKFLRPTSLPLKPGSFIPKRLHQGTTPTVLSLVSPETPRPKKSYGQLFLNGHAYTYLGLKCSTRSYYCTISRPQPMYVVQSPQLPRLSMYSNWKVYSETEPLGLTPGRAMAQYDSRYRTGGYTTAASCQQPAASVTVTHSSLWMSRPSHPHSQDSASDAPEQKRLKVCNGGYESLEEYTYVRGRGRGRYVCEECGIRCKKPSMLKKHIKTHTDVRPYSCRHCAFAFKTKGNLTKHMKSKAHYKRCLELGVEPTPPGSLDAEGDSDRGDDSASSDGGCGPDSDDSDDDDSNGLAGTDALEREAACSLLSLSASPQVAHYVAAGLLPRAMHDSGPACYPYTTLLLKNAQVQTEVHPPYREEVPIDLSQKEPFDFLSEDSQFLRMSRESITAASVGGRRSREELSGGTMMISMGKRERVDRAVGTAVAAPAITQRPVGTVPSTLAKHEVVGTMVTVASPKREAGTTASVKREERIVGASATMVQREERTIGLPLPSTTLHRDVVGMSSASSSVARETGGVQREDRQVLSAAAGPKRERQQVAAIDSRVPAYLAASIANMQDKPVVEPPGHMLQAYLTAKALRDVQIKQQHRSRSPELPSETTTVSTLAPSVAASDRPSLVVSTSTFIASASSTRLLDLPIKTAKSESVPTSRILVCQDPSDAAKRVIVNIPTSGLGAEPAVSSSSEQRVSAALSKTHDANLKAEFFPPASGPNHSYVSVTEDGRSICVICNKTFSKPSQLRLHVNIHYFERPFRCEACAVSFRTKGHLQKHERSVSHHNKVSMNTTFGTATTTNPRPFKCDDCKIAFRIHGHLAKHLRSKMHIMKLECLGKIPFGTYAELERSGYNLNEIDTTDCDNSLESLQVLAQKLYEKDSSKFGQPPPMDRKSDDCGAESDGSSSEGLHAEHFPCGLCGETCDTSSALQVHMFAEHNKNAVLDKRKSED